MEIVFFWIQEYYGIKEQGFNLGSEYVFEVVNSNDQYELTAKDNPHFIPNFFQSEKKEDESKLLNVSAIVGENGAGKSITLEFLREILRPWAFEDNIDRPRYILVFRNDENHQFYCRNNVKCSISIEDLRPWDSAFERQNDVVYFTPVLNPKPTFDLGNAGDIDISTRALIARDWVKSDFRSKGHEYYDDPIIPYTIKNTQRHAQFLSNHHQTLTVFDGKNIAIPKGVFVSFNNVYKNRFADLDSYDNLPYDLRKAQTEIYEIWISEGRKDQDEASTLDSPSNAKAFIVRDFKISVLMALAYQLNRTNQFLNEISFPSFEKAEEPETFDEYFEAFMEVRVHQPHGRKKLDAIPSSHFSYPIRFGDIIEPLIDSYTQSINTIRDEFLPSYPVDTNTLDMDLDAHIHLHEEYIKFLSHLSKFNKENPIEFMDFESNKGMSAGEKALLDLYSRFHVCLTDIVQRSSISRHNGKKLTLYLLIDEGEIGFHLRWQTDYIKDLIGNLPKIISLAGYTFKLQVIFTTHSPLSLSDLPSSNVTYLRKNESTGEIIPSGELNTLTFGANIQSLMAHSFFLEKGAVGEFAKHQIQKLINTLQVGKNFKHDEVFDEAPGELKKRIEMIGEPFLRDKLLDMLYGNEKYGKELKIEALEDQLNRLRHKK